MGIKLVAFDIGGVLANINKTCLPKNFFVDDGFSNLTLGETNARAFFRQASLKTREDLDTISLSFQRVLSYRSECAQVLNSLRTPFTFWSNINKFHFDHFLSFSEILRQHQEPLGLSFQLHALKPFPSFFARVLGRSTYKPREIMFLDDKCENVETAKRFGIQAFEAESVFEMHKILARYSLLNPRRLFKF